MIQSKFQLMGLTLAGNELILYGEDQQPLPLFDSPEEAGKFANDNKDKFAYGRATVKPVFDLNAVEQKEEVQQNDEGLTETGQQGAGGVSSEQGSPH